MSIRVLLADNHKIMREGLRSMLEDEPSMAVIGEAENGRSAVQMAIQLTPDVVLMDVAMPDLNGVDATRQIVARCSDVRVLALSMHSDASFVAKMLEAGASGYLVKDCPFQEVVEGIIAVANGKTHLCPIAAEVALGDYVRTIQRDKTAAEPASLTPREREVLQLIAEGKNRTEIASQLHISAKTADTHRRNLMVKLKAHSVADLIRYAIQQGLTFLE